MEPVMEQETFSIVDSRIWLLSNILPDREFDENDAQISSVLFLNSLSMKRKKKLINKPIKQSSNTRNVELFPQADFNDKSRYLFSHFKNYSISFKVRKIDRYINNSRFCI